MSPCHEPFVAFEKSDVERQRFAWGLDRPEPMTGQRQLVGQERAWNRLPE